MLGHELRNLLAPILTALQLMNLRGVVLVAVTGYAQELDRRRTAAAGFDAHLAKPIDGHELDRLIRAQASRLRAT